jgi:hypothetical protein
VKHKRFGDRRLGVAGWGKPASTVTERVRFLDFPPADADADALAAVFGIPHGVAHEVDKEQPALANAPWRARHRSAARPAGGRPREMTLLWRS